MPITLENLIAHHARHLGDCPAVSFGGETLNWREFDSQVNRLANALHRAGIDKGDKVATALPNSLELLTIYWASVSIGAVLVPLSPLLNATGLANLLENAEVRLVFLTAALNSDLARERERLPLIEARNYIVLGEDGGPAWSAFIADSPTTPPPRPAMDEQDLFNIVYSSGTTGLPKGIMHSHLVRAHYGSHCAGWFRMTRDSVVLHTGSIVFNGAFVTLMPCFFLGAHYILHPQFDVESMIETVRRDRVTHIMMVPAQIIALLQSENFTAENMASLEMLLTIGAPLQQTYKEQVNAIIPRRFYELYGLTEGFVTVLDRNDFDRYADSVGCPPPGFDMRIVDDQGVDLPPGEVGEIVGRGPALSSGYYRQPQLTAETFRKGWLYTGDLGYADEDGFLYLAGRKKELIISGGVNVFPQDIEAIAARHESLLEVAVFGIESDKWGESPVAAVVLKAGAQESPAEIAAWINARVEARFQKVADVYPVDQMPRNVAGKTLKHELKDRYLADRKQ
ncbi:MAG: class I adenylate-forming enzyme family protein [Gammaproteobacteria bacterium]|nr:class I adenylate-forming enzyme family protein [Gammaproteobacteria bacterium]